jgi:hypothetical protein
MRAALAVAPRWAQSVAAGVFFALMFALMYRAWGEDWGTVIASGVVTSVIYSAFAYRTGLTRDRELRETLTPLNPARRRIAVRAAHRGPVPSDPAVLGAALDIAGYDLAHTKENRVFARIVMAALTVAAGVAAIVQSSPWWAIAAVLLAGSLTVHLIRGYTLPGRIDRLQAAEPRASALDDI